MSDEPTFVDSNILVYAYAEDDTRRSEPSRELMEHLVGEGRFRTSTQVLQELYVTLTRKLKKSVSSGDALRYLDSLADNPVVAVDYPSIRAAVHLSARHRLSFWDALVLTSAEKSGARILYTEDLQSGQTIHGVRIVNPFYGMN